ncbi:MAG: cation transporter [Dehalococcoidales bacterium]|nr:MAG: cation transporter [Dehalococcoidales bacterium]
MMHEGHDHHQIISGTRPLLLALLIVVVVMVAEIVGGLLSNSLALLGDAGHMLVDALALSISLIAIWIARRPADTAKTYGYHRVEIMAALANGVILVLVAVFIFYQAYQRLLDPPEVEAPLMMGIAVVGLVANLAGILLLRRARHSSINVKAAFWHVLGDTISSLGVIIGGIIIAVTGWGIVDPIIAIVIGGIILWGAARLVKESSDILLEAVPGHIQMDEVGMVMMDIPGVRDVHDMHIWTITSGIHALSAHVLIEDQTVARSAEIVRSVEQELARRFNITHTTLQLECEKCESCSEGLVCGITRQEVH